MDMRAGVRTFCNLERHVLPCRLYRGHREFRNGAALEPCGCKSVEKEEE